MSNYENFVGALARQQEARTIQNYERDYWTDPHAKTRERINEELYLYNNVTFANLIFSTALSNISISTSGDLSTWFYKHEDDIVSRFSKMNEECLCDPVFSEDINNGKLYSKYIYGLTCEARFYPSYGVGSSRSHQVKLDLSYLPSPKEYYPNIIRLEVKEFLRDEYTPRKEMIPFIKYSIDFGDDESIMCRTPVMVIGKQDGDKIEEIASAPCDMSSSYVKINNQSLKKSGLDVIRSVLMELFEKSGIKEPEEKGY